MSSRTSLSMMGASRSVGTCRCCSTDFDTRGPSRSRERSEWPRDAHRGEVDGDKSPWLTDDVHALTEPGGFCADWPGSGTGDGAWDYEQEDVPYWWYQAIIPAEYRLPHLTTAW